MAFVIIRGRDMDFKRIDMKKIGALQMWIWRKINGI